MQFVVPQFIERKTRILGPLTFRQLVFAMAVGGICIFLFFTVPFPVFLTLTIILGTITLALLFLKIKKIPLPIFIKNLILFLFKPKIYLWRKKITPLKVIKKEKKEEEKEEETKLKMGPKSHLNKLITYIETK